MHGQQNIKKYIRIRYETRSRQRIRLDSILTSECPEEDMVLKFPSLISSLGKKNTTLKLSNCGESGSKICKRKGKKCERNWLEKLKCKLISWMATVSTWVHQAIGNNRRWNYGLCCFTFPTIYWISQIKVGRWVWPL